MEIASSITEAELAERREGYRLQGTPLVRRSDRTTQGGGFGRPDAHPLAWTVCFMIDGQWRQLSSVRGKWREWTSLDRVVHWMETHEFEQFTVVTT